MHLFKFFLLILSIGSLVGCSIPSPEKRDDGQNQGTFYISQVRGSFTSVKTHETFSLPVSRTLSLRTCLKDQRYSKSINQHKFEVLKQGQRIADLTTDDDGCLVWQEEVEFNALLDAKWIKIERSLKAQGQHKGSRTMELLLDPWTEKVVELRDSQVRENSFVAESRETLLGARDFTNPLHFEFGRVTIHPTRTVGESRQMLLDLILGLSVESRSIDGQKRKIPITRGAFKYQAFVFYQEDQSAEGRRHMIYQSPQEVIRELNEGQIIFQKIMNLENGILCTTGTVYIGIRVEPVNGPQGLGRSESVFHYGPCEQRGTSFATPVADFKNRYQQNRGLTIESYIQGDLRGTTNQGGEERQGRADDSQAGAAPNSGGQGSVGPTGMGPQAGRPQTPGSSGTQRGFQRRNFHVSTIEARHISFDPPNGTERKRNLRFEACVMNLQDNRPLRMAQLQVETLSGRIQPIETTDARGCFNFDDQIRYEMFGPECWIKGRIIVKHPASGGGDEVEILYNPWADDNAFRDLRPANNNMRGGEHLEPRCADGRTELVIQNYFLNRERIEYDVDKFLDLKITNKSTHTIVLGLKRPSFTENAGITDDKVPPNTKFLARIALADQSTQDLSDLENKIFSFQEKIVQVRSGSDITEELVIGSENQRMRKNRNRLLVELLPLKNNFETTLRENPSIDLMDLVNHNTNLARKVYAGPVILQNDGNASGFREMPNSSQGLDPVRDQWRKDRENRERELTKASTPEFLAENLNLEIIDIENAEANIDLRKALSAPLVYAQPQHRDRVPPLSIERLKEFIEKGVNDELVRRDLCLFWFAHQWPRFTPAALNSHQRALELSQQNRTYRIQQCAALVRRNPKLMFEIEQKIFVSNPRKISQFRVSAPQREFSVSYDFSMDQSTSVNLSRSVSANLSLPQLSFIPVGIGAGGGVSISRSSGQGAGIGYSSALKLDVDILGLKIGAEKMRKCLIVRLNPLLFVLPQNNFWKQTLAERIPEDQQERYMKSGFLFCEREKSAENLEFNEKYYAINQDLSDGSILDPNNDDNRVFFISLRGEKDFRAFISAVVNLQEGPEAARSEFLESRVGDEPLNLLFLRGSPTTPKAFSK